VRSGEGKGRTSIRLRVPFRRQEPRYPRECDYEEKADDDAPTMLFRSLVSLVARVLTAVVCMWASCEERSGWRESHEEMGGTCPFAMVVGWTM